MTEPELKEIQDGIKMARKLEDAEPVRAVPRMPEMIFKAETPLDLQCEISKYLKWRRATLFKTLTLCGEGPLRTQVDKQISLIDSIIDDIDRADIVLP